METLSVQQLHQHHAACGYNIMYIVNIKDGQAARSPGVGRRHVVEDAECVEDGGHGGVVRAVDEQLRLRALVLAGGDRVEVRGDLLDEGAALQPLQLLGERVHREAEVSQLFELAVYRVKLQHLTIHDPNKPVTEKISLVHSGKVRLNSLSMSKLS